MNVPANVSRWQAVAQKYAALSQNLEPNEILAIVWTESTGVPGNWNPSDPSWGLMGVSRLIALAYGHFPLADDSWHTDPEKNVMAGSAFLSDLKRKYSARYPLLLSDGSPNALGWPSAYNEGEAKFLKSVPDLAYVSAFIAHYGALNA